MGWDMVHSSMGCLCPWHEAGLPGTEPQVPSLTKVANILFLLVFLNILYVNVIHAALSRCWQFGGVGFSQLALALGGKKTDFVEHDFDVFTLLFELGAAAFEPD